MDPPDRYLFPLSFAQQRLWLLDRLDPGRSTYNSPLAVRLKGRLNVRAIERAIDQIVARHEVLRSTFAMTGGEPVQVVHPATASRLACEDLREVGAAERAPVLARRIREEATRPFDLSLGPMLRARLFVLGTEDHALVLTVHHIATDAWSTGILIGELSALYAAYDAGQTPSLSELPIQYADFAIWQRDWLQGGELAAQLDYWRQQLEGAPSAITLPTDRPRPPVQTSRGAVHTFTLPSELTTRIERLGARHGATPYMTLLAAFAWVLGLHSGQRDLVVGTPIANRTRPELEPLIGFFVNTLAMRIDLPRAPTFAELVLCVREVALGAYAHQDLPFEKLVEELAPPRDTSRSPIFQVMFALQNTPTADVSLPGLILEPIEVDPDNSKTDLALVFDGGGARGLRGTWQYNPDLFDADTVARLTQHLVTFFEAVARDASRPLDTIDVLGQAERDDVVATFNAPLGTTSFKSLVERVASAPSDAVACRCDGRTWTYACLRRQAATLAQELRRLGVGPESRVGLCVERGASLPLAVLAIWMAGGAYVPLDPAYPSDRLAWMLDDAAVSLVLTDRHCRGKLPQSAQWCILLDDIALADGDDHAPLVPALPAQLAYIIYTSGSTGRPKGVCVSHAGLCNLADVQRRALDVEPDSRVLLFASPSFDASVWELIMALGNGATLCLAPADSLRPGPDLFALLAREAITHVTLPPSVLAVLGPEPLPLLRCLVVAGEACPPAVLQRWMVPPRRVVNAYGPTETTVCASMVTCDGQLLPPNIGRPLANFAIYILDENGQPAPIGVVGELYVAGIGLARGYRDPSPTAERFVPNPFGPPGTRLYRTGDQARWRSDGTLLFEGRRDGQVKLRGHRIELGEIEHLLAAVSGVAQSAAAVRNDRLVAYWVPEPGLSVEVEREDLERALRDRLPDFMRPAAYVRLDALPLNAAGKTDRKALPDPSDAAYAARAYEAPRGEAEEALARVWSEILRRERVGRNDNFFELGGHSLLAVQLLSRLASEMHVDLPLRELFARPTVAAMATALRATGSQPTPPHLVPLRPSGESPPLFGVHESGGTVAYLRALSLHLDPRIPVYGIEAAGLVDGENALRFVPEMAARYVVAMKSVQPKGPYRLIGYSAGGTIAYAMAEQLQSSGETVSFVGLIDSYAHLASLPHLVEFMTQIERQPELEDAMALRHMGTELLAHAAPDADRLQKLTEALYAFDVKNGIEAMIAHLRRADLVPQHLGDATLRRMLRVRLSITSALYRYRPARVSARVILFQAAERSGGDPTLGWAAVLAEDIRLVPVGGTHAGLMKPPYISVLGRAITEAIDES